MNTGSFVICLVFVMLTFDKSLARYRENVAIFGTTVAPGWSRKEGRCEYGHYEVVPTGVSIPLSPRLRLFFPAYSEDSP